MVYFKLFFLKLEGLHPLYFLKNLLRWLSSVNPNSSTIINVSFKDEVLMGQLTRSVSVTSGHSATYTVYGVEITEREDDRGNYDSWEENYTFAVTSGSPASRLDSYDRYNGEVSESMTSKEKSFTLVVDGVTVCSNEPISNVGKVDKVIGNYRYIF